MTTGCIINYIIVLVEAFFFFAPRSEELGIAT